MSIIFPELSKIFPDYELINFWLPGNGTLGQGIREGQLSKARL